MESGVFPDLCTKITSSNWCVPVTKGEFAHSYPLSGIAQSSQNLHITLRMWVELLTTKIKMQKNNGSCISLLPVQDIYHSSNLMKNKSMLEVEDKSIINSIYIKQLSNLINLVPPLNLFNIF